MYVCMYIYIYIYIYIHIYIYVCVCVYTYVYIHRSMDIWIEGVAIPPRPQPASAKLCIRHLGNVWMDIDLDR